MRVTQPTGPEVTFECGDVIKSDCFVWVRGEDYWVAIDLSTMKAVNALNGDRNFKRYYLDGTGNIKFLTLEES